MRFATEPPHTLATGMNGTREGNLDVVFLDVKLPGGNELEQFLSFSNVSLTQEIIIITGTSDRGGSRTCD